METVGNFNDIFAEKPDAPLDPSRVIRAATENGKVFDPNSQTFIDKPNEYDFGDSWSAFRQEGGSLVEIASRQMALDNEYDEDFRFNDEVMETYFKDTPESFHDYMFEAQSIGDLEQRMEQVAMTQKNQAVMAENFGDSPVTTVIAMLGSGMLTEENAAITAIPIAGGAIAGVKGLSNVARSVATLGKAVRSATTGKTRVGTMTKLGAITGVQGGLESLYASNVLPDFTVNDVLVDTAFSTLFGGTIGGFVHNYAKHADDLRELDTVTAVHANGELNNPDIQMSLNAPESTHAPQRIDEIDSPEQGKTILGTNWVGKVLSQGAALRDSVNPIVRNFSRIMVQDNRVNNKAGTNIQSVSSIQTRISRSARARLARVSRPEFNKWRKTTNHRWGSPKAHAEFEDMTTRAVRSDSVYANSPKEVQLAADNAREVFKDILEQKKRYRVIGAKDTQYDRNYVPTDWDSAKLRAVVGEHGNAKVSKILGQSMAAKNGWDLTFSVRLSRLFIQKVSGLDTGIYGTKLDEIMDDAGEMRKWLIDQGLTDAEIDEGMGAKMSSSKDKKRIPDTNMRQRLDMDYETKFHADGLSMSVSELLNNNMADVVQNYSFKSGRHIGFARNGIDGAGMDTFDQAIKKVEKWAEDNNQDPVQLAQEIKHINSLLNGLKGSELINDDSLGINKGKTKGLQIGRNVTYLAYSGYFGMMSIIESANIIAYAGLKTIFQVAPEYKDWLRAARNGEISNDDMQDIIDASGLGTHGVTGSASTRIDEIGGMTEHMDAGWQKARQVQGVISGLTPVTDFLQRLDAAAMRKKWINQDIPKAMRQDTGITDAMYDRIQVMIKKHGDGKRTMGYNKWDDIEAQDAFINHISIEVRNNVQETDLGATNSVLRGQVGSTLGQFMSFAVASQEQQFARMNRRAVNGMGVEAAYVVMGQMLLASLVTTARTHISASGRSDEREYLEKNLSPDKIALATVSYTGAFGVIGMATQVPDKMLRGFGSGAVSNPLAGYLDGVGHLAYGLFKEGDMSEQEYRSMVHMLPMINQAYTKAGLNAIAADFGD
jgi:hypothetical protein